MSLIFFAECVSEPGCLKCNTKGCIKCPHYITFDEHKCVPECPNGFLEEWSTVPDLMGRVCRLNGYSDPMIATIVGLTAGAVFCLATLILGIMLIKRKQRRKLMRDTLNDDSIEREDFLKQLAELRPNAEYFLAMLNDTRRQVRKLYLSGDQAGANSYRPIVRDLAKILILINRPIELIAKPPHDWHRVFIWSLRILDRYKPQVAQLIDFLQTPSPTISDPRLILGSSQYSTFKSTNTTNTALSSDTKNLHQMQIFGSLISLHEFEEPSSNPFKRNSCSTLKSVNNYPSSDIHGSSVWLEDEFFKLGFRPQDEITTEL